MAKIALTRNELEKFAMKRIGFRKEDMRRMSTHFLAQLLQMQVNDQIDTDQIAAEVVCLESRCQWLFQRTVQQVVHREPNTTDDQYFGLMAQNRTGYAYGQGIIKKKMAGQWLVLKKHHGINYYLTLAMADEGDQNIYKRVCSAYDFDFPFLRECAYGLEGIVAQLGNTNGARGFLKG